MSILSGPEIEREIAAGSIEVDPFDQGHVNPASIDLTLGDEVAVYTSWVYCGSADEHERQESLSIGSPAWPFDGKGLGGQGHFIHDARAEAHVRRFSMDARRGWVLNPGVLYLMHTRERIRTEKFVPVLDGKSSIGRLGIIVHLTAGFGDPGFDGQFTLEVTCAHPVRIYPGMRFCQLRFHTLKGEVLSYQKTGHYVGRSATGPVPSQAHLQFKETV